ncbi:MAG: 1,4-dihydroxy-6-naphthoate synthase [Flavobacteriales bacterium]|nr:1,4-dihydroxy-6-naphthoate synthase [Flavobacteriales bacterium]
MKLTLGFSPCPNDTFMFDALVHAKVDTEGLEFEVVMEDVEALNQRALNNDLDVTKLSYHAFLYCVQVYSLLNSGSALGRNCGPLLIQQKGNSPFTANSKIAIPGKNTTANLLLNIAFPHLQNKEEMLFSDIEQAVIDGRVDAGLIIHENRFTFQEKGLEKIQDLGEFWETETGLPIPLGGIVVKRDLPLDVQQKVQRVLKRSIQYAFDHPKSAKEYIRCYAQEMDEQVMYEHIKLYVNNFSLDLGLEGKQAVEEVFKRNGMQTNDIFVV